MEDTPRATAWFTTPQGVPGVESSVPGVESSAPGVESEADGLDIPCSEASDTDSSMR